MKSRKPSPFSHRIARVTSSEVKQYSGNYVEHIARERSTPITRSRMTSTDYGGRSGSRSFATISLMRRWIYATGDSTALVSPEPPFHDRKRRWYSVPRCARLGRARHHRLRR